ncbi:hypothetical protein BX070DRAFT_227225 [Coemansia spiralis]|nr:hypothetical protein BX070DRAFT_227225 [Coemansia spiralis]
MSDMYTARVGLQRRAISTELSTKTATPPPNAGSSGHGYDNASILTRVSHIVDFLKKSQRPCTADEIRMHIPDFEDNGPEFQHLSSNAKVTYDRRTNAFAYKPEFDIRTPEELVKYLRNIPDHGGLDVKKLSDSYLNNVSQVIAELRQKRHILAITDKDNRPRYIFYNCKVLENEVGEEIRSSWTRLVVPEEPELGREMRRAGLQPTKVEEHEVQEQTDVKKPKKAARKTRITNTHLEDIDLTKDFVPEGK